MSGIQNFHPQIFLHSLTPENEGDFDNCCYEFGHTLSNLLYILWIVYIGDVFKVIMLATATATFVLALATLGVMTEIGSFLLDMASK